MSITFSKKEKNDRRFAFGANWKNFSKLISHKNIQLAKQSLCEDLGLSDFTGLKFLDVGSGSGLFSLAARMLGANVYSFDFDRLSVECTRSLKNQYFPHDLTENWDIQQGSILDLEYVSSLPKFDIVYSWGVLHHTGDLSNALENILLLIKPGGYLFISIYNDQSWISKYWYLVKRVYNSNQFGKFLMILAHLPYLYFGRLIIHKISGGSIARGMDIWWDMLDWLGGYPFEVAKPEVLIDLLEGKSFQLVKKKLVGKKLGCNEFVFIKCH